MRWIRGDIRSWAEQIAMKTLRGLELGAGELAVSRCIHTKIVSVAALSYTDRVSCRSNLELKEMRLWLTESALEVNRRGLMQPVRYDLIVIGSGPAGQKGAIAASKLGKRVAHCRPK